MHHCLIDIRVPSSLGTKIMQVGKKSKIRTYNSEIPNMGTIRGLIDSQLLINYIESLASQVDIRNAILSQSFAFLISQNLKDRLEIFVDIAYFAPKVRLN